MGELWCGVALEDRKVFATTFAFSEKYVLRRLLKQLTYDTVFQVAEEENGLAEEVMRTVKSVYDGKDVSSSFQFATIRLSDYARTVLKVTRLVQTGYVTTYGDLANSAGGSPRSVGRVMAINPFAPLVPCHRVIASDMTLGGYGFGLKVKWDILQKENRKYEDASELEIGNQKMNLFPISMVRPGKNELEVQHAHAFE
jgi:methylated-DNA-[protein]-cysteine S-methyltransferase